MIKDSFRTIYTTFPVRGSLLYFNGGADIISFVRPTWHTSPTATTAAEGFFFFFICNTFYVLLFFLRVPLRNTKLTYINNMKSFDA